MTNTLSSVAATVGDSIPLAIASWLACLVVIIMTALLFIKLIKELRGKPAASEVAAEAADRYVTKTACERQHDQMTTGFRDLFAKMGGIERGAAAALSTEVRDLRRERKEDATVLQAQLTAFSGIVGGLKQASALHTDKLNRMDEKLDYLLQHR